MKSFINTLIVDDVTLSWCGYFQMQMTQHQRHAQRFSNDVANVDDCLKTIFVTMEGHATST